MDSAILGYKCNVVGSATGSHTFMVNHSRKNNAAAWVNGSPCRNNRRNNVISSFVTATGGHRLGATNGNTGDAPDGDEANTEDDGGAGGEDRDDIADSVTPLPLAPENDVPDDCDRELFDVEVDDNPCE